MNIKIKGRGFELGPALGAYAERRAWFAMGRFAARIEGLARWLSDANGPRGGVDKQCQIVARLRPSGTLRVAEQNADLYAAIDRASERLSLAMARAGARARARRRAARLVPAGAGLG